MMKIKKVTFWNIVYTNDEVVIKSAIDRLNEYITKNQISKCDIINVETEGDCERDRRLNLFYWESE